MSDIIAPRRGEALVGPEGGASLRFIQYLEEVAARLNTEKVIFIDIDDWNMSTTVAVTVAHGLTLADIRNISVTIRNDADTTRSSLLTEGLVDPQQNVIDGNWTVDATNVTLNRVTGSDFDSATYNSTSFNRGWIRIGYV